MADPVRPAPVVNPETQPFWDAAAEGRLILRRCTSCRSVHWYPRARCPSCFGTTEWVDADGGGTVYAFSVTRGKVAYVLAYVTLAEGVTMLTNIVDCDPDTLSIGMPVRVRFSPTDGGPPVPTFVPA